MDQVVLTFDVDWAPDFVVEDVCDLLEAHAVRSTWFVTHDSPVWARLRAAPELYELGIHPNFLANSTQGRTPDEILDNVLSIVPEACSVRPHATVQSGPLLQTICRREQLRFESAQFLPGAPHLRPVPYWCAGRRITRVPICWADDYALELPSPDWRFVPVLEQPGLKVMLFHPIHVYLNSATSDAYGRLKTSVKQLSELRPDNVANLRNRLPGTRTLLIEAARHLVSEQHSVFLKELRDAAPAGSSAA